MRLLFVGDLAPTGFGSVTTDLGRALLGLGIDVRFLSQNDMTTALPEPFASRTADLAFYEFSVREAGVSGVRSILGDIVAGVPGHRLVSGAEFGDWKPDAVMLLGDFAAARILYTRFQQALDSVPTFHYVPIEGVDLPPLWADIWRKVRPIAMSRFGQEQIERVTGVRPPLAYHGVDREVFRPVSPSAPLVVPTDSTQTTFVKLTSKEACKRFFSFDPGWTIILRTDRNMPRKRYASLLRALGPVLEDRPDARLVIHASAFDQGGFLPDDVPKMSKSAGDRVIITDRPGLPRPVLAALYNAADLYVTTSAEGFGLTIAEAVASGVPAVALDYSAVPEVVGPAGVVVPVGGHYDNEYSHLWAWPDEQEFGRQVARLVDRPARRRELGSLGPKHVAENFSWHEAARVISQVIAGSALVKP